VKTPDYKWVKNKGGISNLKERVLSPSFYL
jgi:hypothetical protein